MQKFIFSLLFFLSAQLCFADTCEHFQQALETASRIRGLKILKTVNCKSVSAQEFSEIIHKANLINLDKLKLEATISKMIGLIPQAYDYERCYVKNDLESVMASYVPEDQTVYIPTNTKSSFDLLVHEATHALQDQHFDLKKLSKLTATSTDAYYAFLALAEGDAEIVQLKYLQTQEVTRKSQEYREPEKVLDTSCEIPQALLFQLDFPYFWGTRYARTLKEINKSFSSYPKYSTEILYPNKNFKFKAPTKKETFKLANQHYKNQLIPKPIAEDSLGEYTLRCILRELIGSRSSVIAAYGWLGDKLALYKFKKDNNKKVLSWIINFQNKSDAKELHSAFKKSIEKRFNISLQTNADTIIYGNSIYPKIYLHKNKSQVEILISELP